MGGAPEANKALLAGHYKTLKGKTTSRELNRSRVTAKGSGQLDLLSLWRGHERTARTFARKGEG